MDDPTLVDSVLKWMKNNPVIAVFLVLGICVIAAAQFTDAFDKLRSWLRPGERTIYRPLAADLENLEMAMRNLANLINDPNHQLSQVQEYFRLVEIAAKPVCDARKSVSEIGNADIRKDLDGICLSTEIIRTLLNRTEGGVGAIAVAAVLEQGGLVKKVRNKIAEKY